mmetsp:Transcript_15041/g.19511  ORF Transcript_15041/g.19511 Transcript_15041/m.19511 type:complete len:479 (+) Transcript_15041:29-1465(+)
MANIKKKATSTKSCACCKVPEDADKPLKCCTKCKLVWYCGKECQSSHWKQPQGHRKYCIQPNERKPPSKETSPKEVEKDQDVSPSASSTSSRVCAICLEPINSKDCKTLECSHTLHHDCFTSLQNSSSSGAQVCPECRKPIKEDDDMYVDEFGRCFCMKHKFVTCHECCYDFSIPNEMREVEAGLRQAPTRLEELSTELVQVLEALEWFKENPGVKELPGFGLDFHKKKLIEVKLELSKLKNVTEIEKQFAFKKAYDKANDKKMELDAIKSAWARENPGKTVFEFGGKDTQRLFDQFASPPNNSSNLMDNGIVDLFKCDYCKKNSSIKLNSCSKCRQVGYCDRKCQKAAWGAHKKLCLPSLSEEELKNKNHKNQKKKTSSNKPSLTWAQLEAFGGAVAEGSVLEVRILKDSSFMRQVVQARDRDGVVKTMAVYTNKRKIDGLELGKILKWKNPRFHWFVDGSSGARIEEPDLENLTIS